MRFYARWGGNRKGTPEDVQRCIVQVGGRERNFDFHQCWRKRGHGDGGLFCAQHARQQAEGVPLFIPRDEPTAGKDGAR